MPIGPSVSPKAIYLLLFLLPLVAKVVASEESPTSPRVCKNIYRCRDFRLSDCRTCIPSWRRKTCARFVRAVFRARLRSRPTRAPLAFSSPALRRLYRSLESAEILNTTYCLGFEKLFISPEAELDVGDNATIYSEGAGQLLTNTLHQLFPDVPVEVVSNVTYSNETTSWASPTPSTSSASGPPDGDEEGEDPESSPDATSDWGKSTDGEEWTSGLSRLFSSSSNRRLSGHLRLPVSSRHVIKSNGDLRKWAILRALRKMTQASDWAAAFQKDSSNFRVVQEGSKTFIVYIGFSDTFVDGFK